jgi:hypothetical protein
MTLGVHFSAIVLKSGEVPVRVESLDESEQYFGDCVEKFEETVEKLE